MISYVKALDMLQSYTAWKVSVFGVFLVRIFPHLDWIQKDPPYLSVFSLNAVKYELEKLQIQTLFTLCYLGWIISNLSTSRSVSFAMELEWEVLLKHFFPVFMCYYLLKAGNSFITWKSWNHFSPLQAKLYDLPIIPSRRNPSLVLETSFSGKFHKIYKTSKISSPSFTDQGISSLGTVATAHVISHLRDLWLFFSLLLIVAFQSKMILTHFRPMFHLWINQVVGFY